MDFISLSVFLGVIGLIVLAISFAAKYLGLSEFVNTINGLVNSFLQTIGRMIALAPKPIRVMIFLVGGLAVIGTFINWSVTGDMFCAADDAGGFELYQSGYATAMFGKVLSDNVGEISASDATVEEVEAALADDTPLAPIEEQPGLVSLIFSSPKQVQRYGSVVNTGEKLVTIYKISQDSLPNYQADTVYVLVGEDTSESDLIGDGFFGDGIHIYVCLLDESFAGDLCEIRTSTETAGIAAGARTVCSSGATAVAAFSLNVDSVTVENSDGTTEVVARVGVLDDTKRGLNLDGVGECGTSVSPSGFLLTVPPTKVYSSVLGSEPNIEVSAAEFGAVSGKYLELSTVISKDAVDANIGSASRRSAYAVGLVAKGGADVVSQYPFCPDGSVDCVLSYRCELDEGDSDPNVRALVFGIDVFSIQLLLVLMIGIGLISFVRWLT